MKYLKLAWYLLRDLRLLRGPEWVITVLRK